MLAATLLVSTSRSKLAAKFKITRPWNIKIQKCYQNEHRFNVVYSRDNLSKLKDYQNVVNLLEYKSVGSHWIDFFVNGDGVT